MPSSSLALQPLLRLPYARDRFTAILEDLFPSGSLQLLQTPQAIAAGSDFVDGTIQIGTLQLPDGHSLALLEVSTSDQVRLSRNRVALRNFVAKFIDEATTHAVLAVFHQPGKNDWRLTYASRRSQLDEETLEVTSSQTSPKRFTFLLGPGETCKTAAGRLKEITLKSNALTLQDVEKAFSVERLNKEFFKRYKEHYENFVTHLLSSTEAKRTRAAFGISTFTEKAERDKADKPIRDFVKRLLGRLVFLHFLQKKGWLGCKPGGKSWTGGDSDFLHSYFTLATEKKEADRFHSRWLVPLFFEALNRVDRPGDVFPPTGTRVPYLNGGLFEDDPAPVKQFDFPAEHFRALLDFFGEYHFTIDENDPEDHEVGIDPEMLGHIFENLLEDNKDKGAYYTPKAIVTYMCRQSLLHYLQTHLGENAELALLLNEKDLTRLEKGGFVHQHARRIADLLDAVKICDPAIGSGAFPIGLLHEILWTRLTLNWELNTPEERAKLKRRIIQNSIHGVDLDPGAVEIARLRFWLALVVDEDQPRPLPNLDYKIHRADSLIEYIRGEPVHLGKVSAEDKRTHGAIQNLIAAKAALFTAQKLAEKRSARFALYRALAEVAMAEFTWLRNDMGLIADDAERAAQLDHGLKEFGHRARLIDNAAKENAKVQDRILAELRAWFDDDKKPTFLWQLHFGEVFANGGFDIVIGNPPYISVEKFARTQIQQTWKNRFATYASRGDIYCFFYERGIDLLKPKGVLSFITSNKFQRAGYGASLRGLLSSQRLHTLIDFCELPVFAAATDPIIVIASRERSKPNQNVQVLVVKHESEINRIMQALELRSSACKADHLTKEGWSFEGAEASSLVDKLKKGGDPLALFIDGRFHYGIKTGLNEAFVIDRNVRDRLIAEDPRSVELIKPWIRGKDVLRWKHEYHELYIIVVPFGFAKELVNFPAIRKHLKQFETDLKARGQCQTSRNGADEGQHHWLELDNNPSPEFLAEFDLPHLAFPIIKKGHGFSAVAGGYYSNDKTTFCVTSEGPFLLSILNSNATEWLCRSTFPGLGDPWAGGRLEYRAGLMKQLPIPTASPADKARLSQLAEACATAAQRGDEATLAVHEAEIDQIVYRLFDLTPDEIVLIESSLAPTREKKPSKRKTKVLSDEEADTLMARKLEVRAAKAEHQSPAAPPPHSKSAESTKSAWLPGELFSLEGELSPTKKPKAAPKAAAPQRPKPALRRPTAPARATQSPTKRPTNALPTQDEILATFRETLAETGPSDRPSLVRAAARKLGYQRTGEVIATELHNAIRTAIRRGVLEEQQRQLHADNTPLGQWDRDFLKTQFLAAFSQHGRIWVEREEAIRSLARWLGYRRTGSKIKEAIQSLINGLIREKRIEKDGPHWIRRT